ncbi:MAG: hypothetical protein QME79_14440 [Bacillota bacterium]|nr:hypothetical protein [Bacillota bacterium]
MSMTVEELARLESAPTIRPEVAAVALLIEERLRKTDACVSLRIGDQKIRAAYEAAFIGASLHTDDSRQRLSQKLTLPPGITYLRIEEVRREVPDR